MQLHLLEESTLSKSKPFLIVTITDEVKPVVGNFGDNCSQFFHSFLEFFLSNPELASLIFYQSVVVTHIECLVVRSDFLDTSDFAT